MGGRVFHLVRAAKEWNRQWLYKRRGSQAVNDRISSDNNRKGKGEACAWATVAVQALDWMAALRENTGLRNVKHETLRSAPN